jgi:hypothetical protein
MTSTSAQRGRTGFALPVAIIALVLLSALVAGALFVSTEELRSGRGDASDQRALAAAEWALDRAILAWDARRNTAQVVGATAVLVAELTPPNDSVRVTATRVQRDAVWMTATATRGGDGRGIPARHTIGASLRLVGAVVPMRAALTTGGSVSVDGGVIDGRDAVPAGATDSICSGAADAAGISVSDASKITCLTCGTSPATGVFGTPPVDSTTPLDSAEWLGDETVWSMEQSSSVELPGGSYTPRPSATNEDCDRSDPLNWGDPASSSPCTDWFPLIHVPGDLVLGPGSIGQGILVVDGSLRLEAGARFSGIVIVRGDIQVSGAGAEIVGAAFAGLPANATVSRVTVSRVTDGGAIRFASCAARRALVGTARLARTPGRWWTELR